MVIAANTEWLNSNLNRAYPLKEGMTGVGSSLTLPTDFIVDLKIRGVDKTQRYFINEVTTNNNTIEISISDFAGTLALKFSINTVTHTKYKEYAPSLTPDKEIYGKIVIGEVNEVLTTLGHIGGSSFNFNRSELEPSILIPSDKENRAVSVRKDGSATKLQGDIVFEGGSGITLTQDNTSNKLVVSLTESQVVPSDCDCPPNFPEISSLNGCPPDCNGNMNIAAEGIITVKCEGSTLTIGSTVDPNNFCGAGGSGGGGGIPGPPGPPGPAGPPGPVTDCNCPEIEWFPDICYEETHDICTDSEGGGDPCVLMCNPYNTSSIVRKDPLDATKFIRTDYYMRFSEMLANSAPFTNVTGRITVLENSLDCNINCSGGSAGNEFTDSLFRIKDNTDASKKVAFECSSITTGTVRTLTVPNKNGTIALTSDIAAASGCVCTDDLFEIKDNTDATKKFKVECSSVTTATTRTLTVPDSDGIFGLVNKIPIDSTAKVADFVSAVDTGMIYTLDPANAATNIQADLPAASTANLGKIVRFLVISTKGSGTFVIRPNQAAGDVLHDGCSTTDGISVVACINKVYSFMCVSATAWTNIT